LRTSTPLKLGKTSYLRLLGEEEEEEEDELRVVVEVGGCGQWVGRVEASLYVWG
jgi:Fe-S cluster assembly iron-binding protein IscA